MMLLWMNKNDTFNVKMQNKVKVDAAKGRWQMATFQNM